MLNQTEYSPNIDNPVFEQPGLRSESNSPAKINARHLPAELALANQFTLYCSPEQ